ncbi:hypothetical protein ACJX0J_034182, partial [Zea mays]
CIFLVCIHQLAFVTHLNILHILLKKTCTAAYKSQELFNMFAIILDKPACQRTHQLVNYFTDLCRI